MDKLAYRCLTFIEKKENSACGYFILYFEFSEFRPLQFITFEFSALQFFIKQKHHYPCFSATKLFFSLYPSLTLLSISFSRSSRLQYLYLLIFKKPVFLLTLLSLFRYKTSSLDSLQGLQICFSFSMFWKLTHLSCSPVCTRYGFIQL